jgi:hypothetical protein
MFVIWVLGVELRKNKEEHYTFLNFIRNKDGRKVSLATRKGINSELSKEHVDSFFVWQMAP